MRCAADLDDEPENISSRYDMHTLMLFEGYGSNPERRNQIGLLENNTDLPKEDEDPSKDFK